MNEQGPHLQLVPPHEATPQPPIAGTPVHYGVENGTVLTGIEFNIPPTSSFDQPTNINSFPEATRDNREVVMETRSGNTLYVVGDTVFDLDASNASGNIEAFELDPVKDMLPQNIGQPWELLAADDEHTKNWQDSLRDDHIMRISVRGDRVPLDDLNPDSQERDSDDPFTRANQAVDELIQRSEAPTLKHDRVTTPDNDDQPTFERIEALNAKFLKDPAYVPSQGEYKELQNIAANIQITKTGAIGYTLGGGKLNPYVARNLLDRSRDAKWALSTDDRSHIEGILQATSITDKQLEKVQINRETRNEFPSYSDYLVMRSKDKAFTSQSDPQEKVSAYKNYLSERLALDDIVDDPNILPAGSRVPARAPRVNQTTRVLRNSRTSRLQRANRSLKSVGNTSLDYADRAKDAMRDHISQRIDRSEQRAVREHMGGEPENPSVRKQRAARLAGRLLTGGAVTRRATAFQDRVHQKLTNVLDREKQKFAETQDKASQDMMEAARKVAEAQKKK